jgi:hypothetical protein
MTLAKHRVRIIDSREIEVDGKVEGIIESGYVMACPSEDGPLTVPVWEHTGYGNREFVARFKYGRKSAHARRYAKAVFGEFGTAQDVLDAAAKAESPIDLYQKATGEFSPARPGETVEQVRAQIERAIAKSREAREGHSHGA